MGRQADALLASAWLRLDRSAAPPGIKPKAPASGPGFAPQAGE